MKKRVYVVMSICFAIIFVLNASSSVFATSKIFTFNNGTILGGAREATEEEITAANQDSFWDEMEICEEYCDRATMEWYTTSMTYYGQELSMSCGPACVKMVLNSIKGTTYSESTIRNNTNYDPNNGTYLVDLVNYINQEQNYNTYSRKYGQTKANMNTHLLRSIKTNYAPAIIGVVENASTGFPYNGTGGHFIVVYAYKSTKDAAIVCDPWAGYVGDSNHERYEISTDDLYDGYDAINCGYGADISLF